MPSRDREADRAVFADLFAEHSRAVLAYALRRCGNAADAEDAVAETFTVAWRRFVDVPTDDGARPWLYGVCRRVLANQRRGDARRWRLWDRLAGGAPSFQMPEDAAGGPAIDSLKRLRPDDQELLRLVAWEELSHAEIAIVLGITPNAVAIRLHRARARFEAEFRRIADAVGLKGLDRIRTSPPAKGRMAGERIRERME